MINNTAAAERLLRVPGVAERLDCEEDLVYRLIRAGKLRAIRVGRLLRVPESAVAEFIANGGGSSSDEVA